ncbi:hypothetical protein SAMN05421819_3561 [Bryocella elongata]|uniref:Uncharacterized protein n=1 Tax=Bryocella elongata TaxID=863522 RepID=A0A1H6B711_9BACT|nr:hypothetical protein [Bryocella elongata]SEG56314.1 hypothetical protein SAMN05421819_3561 [Bryocella elongata]
MAGDRFYAAQSGHTALLLPPVDATGGKASAAFNFSMWRHASIIVALGVTAAAPTAILLEACTDAAGDGATAIPFDYYSQETANGDVLSTHLTATAAGITPSGNDNIFYQIEIDADALPAGSSYLRVHITAGANSTLATVILVLSEGRYAGESSPTVLV